MKLCFASYINIKALLNSDEMWLLIINKTELAYLKINVQKCYSRFESRVFLLKDSNFWVFLPRLKLLLFRSYEDYKTAELWQISNELSKSKSLPLSLCKLWFLLISEKNKIFRKSIFWREFFTKFCQVFYLAISVFVFH